MKSMEKMARMRVTCLNPEELERSKIPDNYLAQTVTIAYDQKDREYFISYSPDNKLPPSFEEKKPGIQLWVDTGEERNAESFSQIEDIIADASGGIINREHALVVLPKKLTQKEIATLVRKYEQNKFFRCLILLNVVDYINMPEQIALNSGFPEEKVSILTRDASGRPEYPAMRRE